MAKKMQQMFSLDAKINQKFKDICKRDNKIFSEVIEEFMMMFIRKDGEVLFDDLYAPRIDKIVERRIDKGIDRLAAMNNNINYDITAVLLMLPALYKKSMQSIEDTLNEFMIPEVLNPNRQALADEFKVATDGQQMIQTVRNRSKKEVNEARRKVMLEKQEAKKAAATS